MTEARVKASTFVGAIPESRCSTVAPRKTAGQTGTFPEGHTGLNIFQTQKRTFDFKLSFICEICNMSVLRVSN